MKKQENKQSKQSMEQIGAMMNLQVIDLATYQVDERAVGRIPKQIAVKYTVLAVSQKENKLLVVTCDPMNLYALEDIRMVTNMRIQLLLSEKQEIEDAIELHYSELDAKTAVDRMSTYKNMTDSYMQEMLVYSEESQAPIVRLLNSLLMKAYNSNVSDIHIEPFGTETVIRMRKDGLLQDYMRLPLSSHRGLVTRTKILAHMDIAERRKPQDGHFKLMLQNTEMNIRVSFVPTVYGEKGVLRFLTTNTAIDYEKTFGMAEDNYKKMLRILKHPYGIIYFAGPTGSGKTTTLYQVLEYLSQSPVNIVTIEEPVERTIPGLNQIQVNEKAGITFETGLRAVLRQDPDIIMVGETRDEATAATSVRAAITGHLVFSTIHTNNAILAVNRLLDMGIPGYMISASLVGVIAQRLVRKVCPYCKEPYEADEEEIKILFGETERCQTPFLLYKGKGCHLCDHTGYRGRIAVHEILEVDQGLRKMISECKIVEELEEYSREKLGVIPLRNEVKRLVLEGITDMEELERITYSLDE